ncbi:cupin domain-containing protein [Tumebacillus sp. ITR2]|uniref:Cupin domain-containing protein n=1 Tax=Tumebacillus amylolyticus TaxID=2801339 RepID=A0ABS1J642_9BACL|nr:cupin domain-containing protein [Tumebacillus amylolyticus]MBL0385138.1 cupin domain-containing protein [Tumebacillus amylolyticus]
MGVFPLTKIHNLHNMPAESIDIYGPMKTLYLGRAAGSEKLYVNVDYVQPGAKSTKYHTHSLQEEFFLILSGTGILRMNDEEHPVKQGDFVAKPAGKGIAHQFINNGTEVLSILDCGLEAPHDVATYPDEDIVYVKHLRKDFKLSEAVEDFTSDPNA